MFDEVATPRDVSQLQLPLLGRVDRDVSGAWQVFGPDGQPSSAVRRFLSDLSASDCAVSTTRSYAYDLLRWFRFLSAVDVEWRQATRREVRDFVRWFRGAPNPQRDRGKLPGRPAAGTLNPQSGKAYLSNGYAPRTINHALSVTWNLAAAEIISLRYDHELRRLIGHGSAGGEVAGARPTRAGGRLAARVG